jgi:hypothetical protein
MENMKNAFVELTERALPEEDITKFVEYLDEREVYRTGLMDCLLKLSRDEMETLLLKEDQVLQRLQEKRASLLRKMEAATAKKGLPDCFSKVFITPHARSFVRDPVKSL